jgi:ferritin
VTEQREEEALMRSILDKLRLIGDGPQSLYFIDKEITQLNAQAATQGESPGPLT